MTISAKRPGFALALAVCMLAVVGSLAAASSYAAREARRAAIRLARQEEAAAAADWRLYALLDAWDAEGRDSLPVGTTDSTSIAPADAVNAHSYVTRITNDLYSVAAVGRSGVESSVEARRRHNLLVRVVRPALRTRAAVVARGDVVTSPDAALSGHDRAPPAWGGCPPPDSLGAPAILIPDGRAARTTAGEPLGDIVADTVAAESSTYRIFGPATAEFLAARADVSLPAGAILSPRPEAGDKCEAGEDFASWGEPVHGSGTPRCERYFPVVHAAGDIVVTAGRGQGLLLVDGRLRIEGPFVFAGVIVSRGGIETTGTSISIYGAVLSAAEGGVRWESSGVVQRSTCAISRAFAAASRVAPVVDRRWSELF